MIFEWDRRKSELNQIEHGFNFEYAMHVFNDPDAIDRFDRSIGNEERRHRIGKFEGNVILVVYTSRKIRHGKGIIRIISARKTSKEERRSYYRS